MRTLFCLLNVDNCPPVYCLHNLTFTCMKIQEKFGQKVKKLREERKISIEYLSNIANIDRTYISEIEKGKRNISIAIIEKLANALEVEVVELFDN